MKKKILIKTLAISLLLGILLSTTVTANIVISPVEPELYKVVPYDKVWVDDDFGPGTPGWQVYAFDKILEHLNKSGGDPRGRERRRVQVALRHINQWLSEGSKLYEKEKRERIVKQEMDESIKERDNRGNKKNSL